MILRYFLKKENPIIGRHRVFRNIENEQKNYLVLFTKHSIYQC